jgi:hypothetical protein
MQTMRHMLSIRDPAVRLPAETDASVRHKGEVAER